MSEPTDQSRGPVFDGLDASVLEARANRSQRFLQLAVDDLNDLLEKKDCPTEAFDVEELNMALCRAARRVFVEYMGVMANAKNDCDATSQPVLKLLCDARDRIEKSLSVHQNSISYFRSVDEKCSLIKELGPKPSLVRAIELVSEAAG